MGLFSSINVASSGLTAQRTRLDVVSNNIANADTPGYRRKSVPFELGTSRPDGPALVSAGSVNLDRGALARIHDPAHPMADASGYYDGSNVNLVIEIADAREAQRSYEANLKMFDQVRQMSSSLMDLLRR